MSKSEDEPASSRREDKSNGRSSRNLVVAATNPSAPDYVDIAAGHILASRYEIGECLGTGGMGTVFRVWDRTLGTHIALKVLHPSFLNDKRALERFVNEVRLARKIRHPGVCSVHDLGEDGRVRFLTMELVEGRNLRRVVIEDQPTLEQTQQYLQKIAEGLAAIHREGIVHRDLKPENVLVDAYGRTVIADFGIAKHTQQESHTVTKAGTPRYMSPEQLRGETIDVRSDIFSFGIMAFELLSGKFPFGGRSEADVTSATLRDPPDLFDAPGLSPPVVSALQAFFQCALAKDPGDRFASAVEMSRAFAEAWAAPSAPPAKTASYVRTESELPVPQRVSRRRWFLVLLGFTVSAMAILAVGLSPKPASSKVHSIEKTFLKRDVLGEIDWRPLVRVEPFKNSSGEAILDADARTMTDSVRTYLTSSPKLRDADRSNGNSSRATWTVRGTLHRHGTKIRLLLEVVDGEKNPAVQPIEVDGNPDDTDAIVKRARLVLLDTLLPLILQKEQDWKAYLSTRDEQARDRLLEYYRMIGTTPTDENRVLGEKLLLQALARDPDYVPALVEHALLLADGIGVPAEDRVVGIGLGLQDLDRALAKAPKDPDALVMRCRLLRVAVEVGDDPTDIAIDKATKACTDALQVSPNSARTHMAFARLYDRQCRDNLSLQSYEAAANVDPSVSPDFRIARDALAGAVGISINNREFTRADEYSRRLVEIERRWQNGRPSGHGVHLLRGSVLLQLGKLEEAKEEFHREIAPSAPPDEDLWSTSVAIRGLMRIAKQEKTQVPPSLKQNLELLERQLRARTAVDRKLAKDVAIEYQWVDPEVALEFLEQHGPPKNFDDAFRRALFLHEAGRDADAQKILVKYPPRQEWERGCWKWIEPRLVARP